MKTFKFKTFLIIVCLLSSIQMLADNVTVDGIVYDVIKKGKVATLINGESCTGNVVVPEFITYEGVDCHVKEIGECAFSRSKVTSITLPEGFTRIGGRAFEYCDRLTYVKLPESLTTIEWSAFYYCKNLVTCNLPCNITTLGDHVFAGCTSLISVSIPENCVSIPDAMFSYCSSLNSVNIPNSVTTIGMEAFRYCSSLTKVIIPNCVRSIGYGAFGSCNNIEDVYCYTTTPPNVESYAFQNSYIEYATLHVPANSVEAYKSAAEWKDFGAIVAIAEEGQCAKPVIHYDNGKLTFSSSTNGASFHYTIKDEDETEGKITSSMVNLHATLNISVNAEANGYTRSETTTATLCWLDGSFSTDGIETVRVEKRPVLVSCNGGELHISGVNPGENIAVYSVSGRQVGATVAKSNEVTLNTQSLDGNIAIIKVGQESVKVTLK